MKFSSLSPLFLAFFIGCAETEDCWWCDDADTTEDGTLVGSDAGSDDGKDDTKDDTKDDDTKDDDTTAYGEDFMTFSGDLDLSTNKGTLYFESADFTDFTGCGLHYDIVGVAVNSDCDDCDEAWSLDLGALVIDNDNGLCDPGIGYADSTIYLGYAGDVLMYADDETAWGDVGFSSIAADTWSFSWDL